MIWIFTHSVFQGLFIWLHFIHLNSSHQDAKFVRVILSTKIKKLNQTYLLFFLEKGKQIYKINELNLQHSRLTQNYSSIRRLKSMLTFKFYSESFSTHLGFFTQHSIKNHEKLLPLKIVHSTLTEQKNGELLSSKQKQGLSPMLSCSVSLALWLQGHQVCPSPSRCSWKYVDSCESEKSNTLLLAKLGLPAKPNLIIFH